MLQGKKVILFDLDGTLIDSVGIWNEVDKQLILRLGGVPAGEAELQAQRDAALRRFSSAPNPYLLYCGALKKNIHTPLTAEQILALRYQIAAEYLKTHIDYKPGAAQLLRWLKAQGFLLVLATTTKRSNIDVYRTENQNMLQQAPLDELFSAVYTREDVKNIKPHPEVYQTAMREFGVTPSDCLVFEDSLVGIEAAKQAGIEVAALYDRYSANEQEQIKASADFYFTSFTAVLNTIKAEHLANETHKL